MFFGESSRRIWLFTKSTDMRKSFNGLTAVVRSGLNERPLSGAGLCLSMPKNLLKMLYFDGSGYCIWFKRLEQRQFNFGAGADKKRRLNLTGLQLILGAIKIEKRRYAGSTIIWYNFGHEFDA